MSSCPDCGVMPGEHHEEYCDVERCMNCGHQLLSDLCDLTAKQRELVAREAWSGEWPGVSQCREFNLYAKLILGRGWIKCDKDDPKASPDLNTLSTYPWDKELKRYSRIV